MYYRKFAALALSIAICLHMAVPSMASGPAWAFGQASIGIAAMEGDVIEEDMPKGDAGWESQPGTSSGADDDYAWEDEPFAPAAQTAEEAPSISLAEEGPVTYTGQVIEPPLIVEYGGAELIPWEDYEAYFENNVRAGTATAHVRGIGAYSFEEDFAFEISPHELTQEDVQTDLGKYRTRYSCKPYGQNTYAVSIGGVPLEEGVDYYVEGAEAFEEGASGAEAVVVGIGSCTGTAVMQIPEYGEMEVTAGGTFIYGEDPEPDVSVRIGGMDLVQGAYAGDGDYYVTCKPIDKSSVLLEVVGEYDGSEIYWQEAVCLSPCEITDEDVRIEAQECDYTGGPVMPQVTVSVNGEILSEGTDYEVSYEDNVLAGTAKAVITGRGNYTGVVTKSFRIKETVKKITPSISLSASAFTYNGKEQRPQVTVKDGSQVLKASDYDISMPHSVNAGTYKVVVSLKGSYSGSGSASYKITQKAVVPEVTLSATSFTYNGKGQKPRVVVKVSGAVVKTSDYDVSLPESVNAGSYKVSVALKGNYSGKKVVTYQIARKAVVPEVTLSATSFTYNGKEQKPRVTVKAEGTPIPASGYDAVFSAGRKDVGTYSVSVSLACNYSGKKSVSYTIIPRTPELKSVAGVKDEDALKAVWSAGSPIQADGYKIQYSQTAGFSKGVNTMTVKGDKTASAVLRSKVEGGKAYYIRIRAYKEAGGKTYYSIWSSVKQAKAGKLKLPGGNTGTITVLDYGSARMEGDAVLVESAGRYILMDTGYTDKEDDIKNSKVIRTLKSMGVCKLDLYLSHWHNDHYFLMSTIMKDSYFTVGTVYLPNADYLLEFSRSKYSHNDWYDDLTKNIKADGKSWGPHSYTEIQKTIKEKGIKSVVLHKGDSFKVGDAVFEVLWQETNVNKPSSSTSKALKLLNNSSLVTRVTIGGIRYLTAGDLYKSGERNMISAGVDLKADIVKTSHHSNKDTSNTPEFYKAVGASWALGTGYASEKCRKAVSGAGTNYINFRENGQITARINYGEITVTAKKNIKTKTRTYYDASGASHTKSFQFANGESVYYTGRMIPRGCHY